MNILNEEEAQLRRLFLQHQSLTKPPSKSATHEAIEQTVQQANAQTGTRDLMVLAVSSFFVFLQVLMAPFVARVASRTAAKELSAQREHETQLPKPQSND